MLAAGWHDMPRVSRELTFDKGQNQTKQAAFSRAVTGLVERGLLFSGGLSRMSGA